MCHPGRREKVMAVKKAATKTATVKAEVKAEAPVKEAVKAVEVKAAPAVEAKAAPVKEAKSAKAVKEAPKKPAAKNAAKTEAKTEVKVSMNVQFGGKSYTTEDLVKIAKDVWEYDLKQKAADFKSVELYVKPEDGMAYYVINGKEAGSFYI